MQSFFVLYTNATWVSSHGMSTFNKAEQFLSKFVQPILNIDFLENCPA